jgi:predicted RNA binding protein YcfA (HicA-like mRNA interferase family)
MKLPALGPKKVISKLQKAGFYLDHQTGSHVALMHKDGRRITVPKYNKDLKKGTLKNILRQAGLTTKQFLDIK